MPARVKIIQSRIGINLLAGKPTRFFLDARAACGSAERQVVVLPDQFSVFVGQGNGAAEVENIPGMKTLLIFLRFIPPPVQETRTLLTLNPFDDRVHVHIA